MNDPSETKIRQLFELALDKPAHERAAFVRRMCGEGTELCARVMELIEANAEVGDFLAQPTAPASPDPISPADPEVGETAGTVIGHYKLLQQIGEGGMGTVWMAEQFEPVRRKVALKIIKLGMDTKQVVVRFEAERQALAMMDHPSIAKVLDGGVTETGRPYFVMELVKGVPITEFCDEAKLDLKQRLKLFTQVCSAVQHAHQKGIIHRDLKPSNVLVTLHDGEPVPKVIDFGIAKATNQELTQKTLFTEYQQILGTPEYMAPEQASMSGLDVDTRADVYSLGVLLYELLTGTKPFDLKTMMTRGYEELLRTIREEDPPKPSTRASTVGDDTGRISMARQLGEGQLGRALRGDLDWIVVKSMEKDRTRRYETANGLAADIRRFLGNEPVTASPPSASYRMRKFVRRNKGPVIAAGLVAVALVLGVVGTAVGMMRAVQEADRAEQAERATARELARANEVKNVVQGMIVGIRPEQTQGRDTTVLKEIIDTTAQRVEKNEIADERVAAELHYLLGHAYASLGAFEEAERHLPQAVEIRTRLLGADDVETLLARAQLALLRQGQGRLREAVAIFEEIVPGLFRTVGPDDKQTIGHQVNLAMGYFYLYRLAEAEELAEKAHAAARRALGEQDDFTRNAAANLALVYRALGRTEAAVERLTQVIEQTRRIDGPDHPSLISANLNLARVRIEEGRLQDAERLILEARRIATKVHDAEHPHVLQVAMLLASLHLARGRTVEAEAELAPAMEMIRRKLSPEHAMSIEANQLLARLYALQARHAEAIALALEGTAIAQRVMGDRSPRALLHKTRTAAVLMNLRRYPEARELFQSAYELQREVLGPAHEKTLTTMVSLAAATSKVGRHEEAARLIAQARAGLEQKLDPADGRLRDTQRAAATVAAAAGKWNEADELYGELLEALTKENVEKASLYKELTEYYLGSARAPQAEAVKRKEIAILQRQFGPKHVRTLIAKRERAYLLHAQGRLAEAQQLYRDVIDALRSTVGPDRGLTIEAECQLAIVYGAQRNFREAERLLLDAQKRAESQWGREHLITIDVYRRLGMVYMDWLRTADAERVLKIAVESNEKLMGYPPFEDAERLAMCAERRGDLAAAEDYYRVALAGARTQLGESHAAIVLLQARLGDVISSSGRVDDAVTVLKDALQMADATLPDMHAYRAQIVNSLAGVYARQGRLQDAVSQAKDALAIYRKLQGEDSLQAISATRSLASFLAALGRYDEAELALKQARADLLRTTGPMHPLAGQLLVALGSVHEATGNWKAAEASYREAQASFRLVMGPASVPAQIATLALASTLQRSGRAEEAAKILEPCLAVLRRSLPKGHPVFVFLLSTLIRCYEDLDRIEEGAPLMNELVQILEAQAAVQTPDRESVLTLASCLLNARYAQSHEPKRGLVLARQACALEEAAKGGKLWTALLTLARAEFQNGDRASALKSLERASKLVPERRRGEVENVRNEFAQEGD